jgi:ABC-type Fe3+ transport system substrate-binding protein
MADVTESIPLAGGTYRIDYGDMVVEHDYGTAGKLSYTVVSGPGAGITYTGDIEVARVRDDICTVSIEDDYARIILVADLAEGRATTFIVPKDGPYVQLQGVLTKV